MRLLIGTDWQSKCGHRQSKRLRHLLSLSFLVLCSVSFAHDETPPLLELGVGGGGGMITDYPGSDQSRFQWAAFPVIFYHGKILRYDREDGAHARVIDKPKYGIDLNGGGYFPVDSNENRARRGMKSLGWLGEMGPRFYYRLLDDNERLWRVFLFTRGALSAKSGDIRQRGGNFGVGMGYDHEKISGTGVSFFSKINVFWATEEYQDYFYSVSPEYATPDRPAYKARSGYLGTWVQAGMSYEFTHLAISGGVSASYLGGAANESSPLVRDNLNWSFYAGIAWFFYRSETVGAP